MLTGVPRYEMTTKGNTHALTSLRSMQKTYCSNNFVPSTLLRDDGDVFRYWLTAKGDTLSFKTLRCFYLWSCMQKTLRYKTICTLHSTLKCDDRFPVMQSSSQWGLSFFATLWCCYLRSMQKTPDTKLCVPSAIKWYGGCPDMLSNSQSWHSHPTTLFYYICDPTLANDALCGIDFELWAKM